MVNHIYYKCKEPCETIHCNFCDGGLSSCIVCDGAEGSLPSECPGKVMSCKEQELIFDGDLDFRDGKWIKTEGEENKWIKINKKIADSKKKRCNDSLS